MGTGPQQMEILEEEISKDFDGLVTELNNLIEDLLRCFLGRTS